jgi:hypothetical protein
MTKQEKKKMFMISFKVAFWVDIPIAIILVIKGLLGVYGLLGIPLIGMVIILLDKKFKHSEVNYDTDK